MGIFVHYQYRQTKNTLDETWQKDLKKKLFQQSRSGLEFII